MLDPRTKDAMRATPVALDLLKTEIASLKEGQDELKKITRAIREAVVRKYKK